MRSRLSNTKMEASKRSLKPVSLLVSSRLPVVSFGFGLGLLLLGFWVEGLRLVSDSGSHFECQWCLLKFAKLIQFKNSNSDPN